MMSTTHYAIVTGASSGIGFELAKLLAKRGYGLILVARRLDRLNQLKDEIQKQFSVPVEVVSQDLSVADAAQNLFTLVERLNVKVEILINNAGFGLKKHFLESDVKRINDMLFLNIKTLTELTLLFGQKFNEQGSGYILQVASIAAFYPAPKMAVYAATKAYVESLGLALSVEWSSEKVSVTTLCPGMTNTEFFEVANQNVPKHIRKLGMSAESVAQIGLKAMFKRKSVVIAGVMNKLNMFMMKFLPRKISASLVGFVVEKFM